MLLLSLLLLKDRQIQTGAEWDTVVGYSVAILFIAVIAVLIALAVSRSLNSRRQRRVSRARRRAR